MNFIINHPQGFRCVSLLLYFNSVFQIPFIFPLVYDKAEVPVLINNGIKDSMRLYTDLSFNESCWGL